MRQDGILKAYSTNDRIVVVHRIRPPVRRGAAHNNESELVLIDAISKESRGAVCG
jgi:preprotein translocase subunit SecF